MEAIVSMLTKIMITIITQCRKNYTIETTITVIITTIKIQSEIRSRRKRINKKKMNIKRKKKMNNNNKRRKNR